MDSANTPNDGCQSSNQQPEDQQQNQQLEERWRKAFESHYDFIVERMSPEFGLIDRLFAHRALTNREKITINEKKNFQEKNEMILDSLSRNHKLETLVELLGKCEQSHLVNYLENDGYNRDESDGDWPLTDEVISTIDSNYADLVDLLEVSELIGHLYATGVVNRRQRDFIIYSKSTPSEQNAALLDILRRSSLRSYWQTIRCLHQTNQSHIAEILEKGGAIVRVDVQLEVKGRNVNEAEKEIATKINNFLSDRSVEESVRIFEQALQMKLIGAKTCHSVSLYFLCTQSEEVERLEKLTKDGRLKEIVESLFNRLVKTPVKIKIDFKWKSEIFNKHINMFQEKELPLTTISRLPLEALDRILQKSYLTFFERESQDQNPRDETIVKQLASVDLCWFKRLTNRRFKSTVWSHLSRTYKVKDRASCLYKCNRQFITENLLRLQADKTILKASGILSDTDYAIIARPKSFAYKKRAPSNGTEALSVTATLRDEAMILDYLRYLLNFEEDSMAKVVQMGGATVRIEMTSRGPNRGQFAMRLNGLRDETNTGSATVKRLISELNANGLEILNSVQDRDAVVWIRCKSTTALEKLKQMNESRTLARLLVQFADVDLQSTNVDGDQLQKDIVHRMVEHKYLRQTADKKIAKEWLRLIEYGVPQDKSLEWLRKEATHPSTPIEYHDTWIVHNDQDILANNDLTEAECLAMRIYSNAVHEFYSKFNEDCANCKWEHYTIFTSLLQSALCKRRRKYTVDRVVEVIPEPDCDSGVKADESALLSSFTSTLQPEMFGDRPTDLKQVSEINACSSPSNESVYHKEIETLIPPFRLFPVKRNSLRIKARSSTEISPILASSLVRGSMIGSVVGNCIGGHYYTYGKPTTAEKLLDSLNELESQGTNRDQFGCTVDTCMTLALANSLTRTQTVDVEDLRKCFCQTLYEYPSQNHSESAYYVLSDLSTRTKEDDYFAPAKLLYGGEGSKGVGSPVRIAPLALCYFYDQEDKFNDYVRTVTALTHSHPIGINGAILQAAAVQLALLSSVNGRHSDDFEQDYVDELIKRMKPIESENGIFSRKLRKIKRYMMTSPADKTIRKELGTGTTADKSVPPAIYCFLRGMKPIPGIPPERTEFERTIIYALNLGGKIDSIASMVGAIAGAYYGQDAVTQRWRNLCETKAIDDAKRYANKMVEKLSWDGVY